MLSNSTDLVFGNLAASSAALSLACKLTEGDSIHFFWEWCFHL